MLICRIGFWVGGSCSVFGAIWFGLLCVAFRLGSCDGIQWKKRDIHVLSLDLPTYVFFKLVDIDEAWKRL
jgi:hypothetical protein